MNYKGVPIARHIGRCIYCGSTNNLTDEHIVPNGLKGPWKLLNGSCKSCNQITSAFEKNVLRGQFLLSRASLGLPTYHPKNRPQEFSFEVEKNGCKEKIVLPVDDCPPIFMMLHLEKPRHVANYDYKKGIVAKGSSLHGPGDAKSLMEKLGVESISFETTFSGTCFQRMLAKIAYGMVIFNYGPDALEESYVLPCILGQKDDAGYWVGNSESDVSTLPIENVLHRISLTTLTKNEKEIAALIRLFANYKTPEYLVIVGKLK
jgi:hypothetical protein